MLTILRLLRLSPLIRRTLGLLCIMIGVIGAIFPVIPGWPAFLLAVLLLGRRDRLLRRLHLIARSALRMLRQARIPHLRGFGRWLSAQYVDLRRAVMPRLIAVERVIND